MPARPAQALPTLHPPVWWVLGFWGWVLGFAVWGLGFGVWVGVCGLGLGFRAWGSGFVVRDLGVRAWGLGLRVEGLHWVHPCAGRQRGRWGGSFRRAVVLLV